MKINLTLGILMALFAVYDATQSHYIIMVISLILSIWSFRLAYDESKIEKKTYIAGVPENLNPEEKILINQMINIFEAGNKDTRFGPLLFELGMNNYNTYRNMCLKTHISKTIPSNLSYAGIPIILNKELNDTIILKQKI